MATSNSSLDEFKFDVSERQYLKISLTLLRDSLRRSLAKEMNPDIRRYREADISHVDKLIVRFGG